MSTPTAHPNAPHATPPAAPRAAVDCPPLSMEDRTRLIRTVFESHYERVFYFLSRRVSAEQAEDLAQEVFFRLLKHSRLETVDITASYLFKIADNLVKNTYRRDWRRRVLVEELQETERVRALDRPSEAPIEILDRRALEEVMSGLTANEQSAITLIVCQGLSYEAASMALGVSVTTINNWKHRGVRKLKEQAGRLERFSDGSTGNTRSADGSRAAPSFDPDRGGTEQAAGSSPACSAASRRRVPTDRFGRAS